MRKKQRYTPALLAVLLLLLLCAAVSGCGDGEGDSQPGDNQESESEARSAEPDEGGESASIKMVMTLEDAVVFLRALPPENLGLTGDSMTDYHVYASDEMVPVDGLSCAKLSVYRSSDASRTNIIQGIYLLARDGSRLYRLTPEDGTVTELPFPEEESAVLTSGGETDEKDEEEK